MERRNKDRRSDAFKDLARKRILQIWRRWELLGGKRYGAVGLGELS